jgi:hypothetical protein
MWKWIEPFLASSRSKRRRRAVWWWRAFLSGPVLLFVALATWVATAFQAAGVPSVELAKWIVILGVWVYFVVAVASWSRLHRWFPLSKWIIVMVVNCVAGCVAVALTVQISNSRIQQQEEAAASAATIGKIHKEVARKQRISAFSGATIMNLYYIGGNPESKTFCRHISEAFILSHWSFEDEAGPCLPLGGEDFYGVRMYLNYQGAIPSHYIPLKRAFAAVGVPMYSEEHKHPDSEKWERTTKHFIRIDVGHNEP